MGIAAPEVSEDFRRSAWPLLFRVRKLCYKRGNRDAFAEHSRTESIVAAICLPTMFKRTKEKDDSKVVHGSDADASDRYESRNTPDGRAWFGMSPSNQPLCSSSTFVYDAEAEARLRRKIDWTVVPTVSILYLFCYIDRANIGTFP